MWKRKELKYRARQVVKKNYWTAIVICFLIALLTGEFGTSILGIWQSDDSMDPNYVINRKKVEFSEDDSNIIEKNFQKFKDKEDDLTNVQLKILEALENNLSSATKSQKYIFKIWDAIESFRLNEIGLGVEFIITAVVAIAFSIFIAKPLTVAGKRYFIRARQEDNTKILEIIEVFKKGNWINISIIMFLKSLYNLLWYLTIIGGIIKAYEYKMIPYILAENPKVDRKKAFKLSKQMMKNNKWKAFLLDASFWGWNILSIFTFGLLNILYVNAYKSATMAELYIELRKTAIDNKYEFFEQLNDKTLK